MVISFWGSLLKYTDFSRWVCSSLGCTCLKCRTEVYQFAQVRPAVKWWWLTAKHHKTCWPPFTSKEWFIKDTVLMSRVMYGCCSIAEVVVTQTQFMIGVCMFQNAVIFDGLSHLTRSLQFIWVFCDWSAPLFVSYLVDLSFSPNQILEVDLTSTIWV